MSTRSRLSRRIEKQSEKSLVLSIIGIVVLLIVVIKFGIPIFVNSFLFGNNSSDSQDTTPVQTQSTFIPAPVLNPLPQGTNSAQIKVSGSAAGKYDINLYVNNQLVDKTTSGDDKTFSFNSVLLTSGNNEIQVKAINQQDSNKQSQFSDP